jgi:hypothetical protein
VSYRGAAFCCAFFVSKKLNAKDIHKERFLFMLENVCHVKQFTTGSKNSLKDVQKSQMMADEVALLRLQQKQLYSGWKSYFELTGG